MGTTAATSSRLRLACIVTLTSLILMVGRLPIVAAHPFRTGKSAVAIGDDPARSEPTKIAIKSGNVTLEAWIWRPQGAGRFPAVLVNHGSGRTREELERLGPYERMAETIGPVFARHGYVLLYLFRRGVGPSTPAGKNAIDLMNAEAAAHGQNERNALQLKLLQGREISDALAALARLRQLSYVDPHRVALIGHSFGGSLTVLMTEREPSLRAAVIFSGAGYSWDRSAELRARLLRAVDRTSVPMFFIHAANDYSTNSGKALDAELARLGKPHRLEIYPPVGQTPDDGHDFPNNSVATWKPDVFAFLDPYMRNQSHERSAMVTARATRHRQR